MANGEKLGMCDSQANHILHTKCPECVNWREQPAPGEPSRDPNDATYDFFEPSSPPAQAGGAREQLVEKLAKALWDQDITDVVKQTGRPAAMYAQWPEDSRIQPYCQRTYRQAEAVADIAEAYAAEQVRQADQTVTGG